MNETVIVETEKKEKEKTDTCSEMAIDDGFHSRQTQMMKITKTVDDIGEKRRVLRWITGH